MEFSILKVLGVISLGCIASTFERDEIRDKYFFGSVLACFVVSLIYFIVHLASYGVAVNLVNKAIVRAKPKRHLDHRTPF